MDESAIYDVFEFFLSPLNTFFKFYLPIAGVLCLIAILVSIIKYVYLLFKGDKKSSQDSESDDKVE